VADGWSINILMKELSALYRSFLRGEASPLSDLPIQYADYAVWQREWLQGEVLERQLSYWKAQLVDVPVLSLPLDKSRPSVQTFSGGKV
ncbi:condensation protein, partial [Enterococcus hirae]